MIKRFVALFLMLAAFAGGRLSGIHHAIMDCTVEKAPYLVLITLDGQTYYHATEAR